MECINCDNVKTIIEQPDIFTFYFTAKWCGPCQKIKPMIIKLMEGLDSNKIKFYMVDIDENDDLCEKCNIKMCQHLYCSKIKMK